MEGFITNASVVFGIIFGFLTLLVVNKCIENKGVNFGDVVLFFIFGTPFLLAVCWWLR